jgi:hypothetical protein
MLDFLHTVLNFYCKKSSFFHGRSYMTLPVLEKRCYVFFFCIQVTSINCQSYIQVKYIVITVLFIIVYVFCFLSCIENSSSLGQ